MDVHSEATVGLKISLLVFGLILVGALGYFVVQSNQYIGDIYANVNAEQLNGRWLQS